MTNTELDALANTVLDQMHEDFDEPHQFSKQERTEMIDAAIEATNAELGLPPTTNPEGDYTQMENTSPQPQPCLVDYVWKCLSDDRHELTYRLRLSWSAVKHELFGV